MTVCAPGTGPSFFPRQPHAATPNISVFKDDQYRATALYLRGALFNHECLPNCVQTFDKHGRLYVRAVRHIQAHQPVTISYLDPYTPRWQRRASLQHSYSFDIDASVVQEQPPGYQALAVPVQQLRVCGEDVDVVAHEASVPPWRHDARDVAMTAVVGHAGGVWWQGLPVLTHPVFSGPEEDALGELCVAASVYQQPPLIVSAGQSDARPRVHVWGAAQWLADPGVWSGWACMEEKDLHHLCMREKCTVISSAIQSA